MEFYPTLITLHITFAGIWLINFLTGMVFKSTIRNNKQKSGEKKFILLYLRFINLFGIIGSMGILITGIILTAINPGYGFFQFTANHWLVSKQIIMVAILVAIFAFIIPSAKKLKSNLGSDLEGGNQISVEGYDNLNKLYKLDMTINLLVLINFLFAITHRFIG